MMDVLGCRLPGGAKDDRAETIKSRRAALTSRVPWTKSKDLVWARATGRVDANGRVSGSADTRYVREAEHKIQTMTASTKRLLAASLALCLPASTVAMHRVHLTEQGTIDEGRHLEVDEEESRNLSHYVSFTITAQRARDDGHLVFVSTRARRPSLGILETHSDGDDSLT